MSSPFVADQTSAPGAVAHVVETSSASESATWTPYDACFAVAATAVFPGVQPPSAPTLGSPANASTEDLSGTPTFTWTPNPTPGDGAESAIAFRMKQSGASAYSYWNAGTSAWQSTVVWNPYTTGSYTFPAGSWADGATYNWSVATQEAAYGLQSPFAGDATVTGQLPPVVSVTAPTGVVATATPTVVWSTSLPAGAQVTAYRLVVYSAEQMAASGFSPGGTPNLYDTGTVAYTTASGSILIPAGTIPNNTTVGCYMQITETGGELSAWASTEFTVSYDAPAVPSVTAVAGTDPVSGCPLVTLTVQGHDNLLSFDDASFEGGVGTWSLPGGSSASGIAVSSAVALDGSYSLAITGSGSSGGQAAAESGRYAVVAGQDVVGLAAFRAWSATRTCQAHVAWWTSAGASAGISTVAVVTDRTAGWTFAVTTGTAPSDATEASVVVQWQEEGAAPLPTPAAPTVTPEGTAGTTTYDYEVAAVNAYGSTPASAAGSTTTGNATLSATDYNLVSWAAVPLPAGSPGNLVYDSNLTNAIASVGPTWVGRSGSSPTIGTADGDWNVLNAGTDSAEWVAYGTGAVVTNYYATIAPGVAVTPGATYTFSALLDATNLVSGNMDMQLYNSSPAPTSAYLELSQTNGTKGVVSGQITIPSGVTVVYPGCQLDSNWEVTAGATISWSQIQLTETSTVQPYAPGPLPTYDVYGRTGTLGLLGSTTALAFEDTGQTPGAAAPTANTTGEVHYVDCCGIMPGAGLGEILTALADSPTVSWELSDPYGSTTAAEELGTGFVGTVNGGVTFGQPGPVPAFPGETAASFDGTSGYISTGFAPTLTTAFSVSAWVNPDTLVGCDIATMRSGGNACGIIAALNADGTISFGGSVFVGTNDYFFESTHRPQKQWYYVAYCWNATDGGVLYVNGAVAWTQTSATGNNTLSADWWIGGGGRGYGSWYGGSIAKVRIYDQVLTSAQVAALYNAASASGSLVEKWTRGGLVGATTAEILRSDNLYVRGASPANPLAIPAATQQASITDLETTPTAPYTYTATTTSAAATVLASPPSGPTASVTTTTTTWWTLDPTDLTTALALDVQQHQTSRTAQQTAHTVLGPPNTTTYPTIVSSAIGGRDGTLTVETHSATEFAAVEQLVNTQNTMWLSSPYGDGIYLRYGPQPGGMSSGVGNKTHDTATVPSPASTPVRTTALSYVGQPRPAV